jgi:hypothetical protein
MKNLKHLRKSKTRKQRGGSGFSPDVSKPKIGGLPEIVGTSDCPAMGPADPGFAYALYGGAAAKKRQRRRTKRRVTKRKY